jgi:predicted GIY-YIG superfamily endonuclease
MNEYICYILKCDNWTYNGCTNNFKRRIRQHNGEITGGAKCTSRRGPWSPYCIITGFQDNIEALQTEWRIKRVEGRRRGVKYAGPKGRIKGLNRILQMEQFTSKSQRLIKDMNLVIYLEPEYHLLLENLPDHMQLKDISEYLQNIENNNNNKQKQEDELETNKND